MANNVEGPSPRAWRAEVGILGVPRSKGPSPRARGAEPSGRSSSGPASGSPSGRGSTRSQWTTPRMLGTDCRAVRRLAHPGNIPAGAENRGGPSVFGKGGRPRECEEQVLQVNGIGNVEGSSPRVWGAGGLGTDQHDPHGTIPAGAGSRRRHSGCWPAGGDHSRMHRKQRQDGNSDTRGLGPSPKRGADRRQAVVAAYHRTIPAGAGSRRAPPRIGPCSRDHLRGSEKQNRGAG